MSSKCIVCNVEFKASLPGQKSSEILEYDSHKIFQVFLDFFLSNDSSKISSKWNLHWEPLPFCPVCKILAIDLCTLNNDLERIQNKVFNMIAQVFSSVLETGGTLSDTPTSTSVDEITCKKVDNIRSLISNQCSPQLIVNNCKKIINFKIPNLSRRSRIENKKPEKVVLPTTAKLQAEMDDDDDLFIRGPQMKQEEFNVEGVNKHLKIQIIEQNDTCQNDDDYFSNHDDASNNFDDDSPPSTPQPRKRQRKGKDEDDDNFSPRKRKSTGRSGPRRRPIKLERVIHYEGKVTEQVGEGRWKYHGKYEYFAVEDGLQCQTCLKNFKTRAQMLLHLRGHDIKDSKIFHCEPCDQSFVQLNDLQKHMQNHGKVKRVKEDFRITDCGDNNFMYENEWSFSRLEGQGWKCGACSFVSGKQDSLIQHIKKSHLHDTRTTRMVGVGKWKYRGKWEYSIVENGLQCQTCSRVTPTRDQMLLHLRAHDIKDSKIHACSICDKSFVQQSELIKHQGTHANNDERYRTTDLGDGKNFLYDHKWPFSAEENKFTCGTCQEICRSRPLMFHHLKHTHMFLTPVANGGLYEDKWPWEVVPEGFKCLTCDSIKTDKTMLLAHIKNRHSAPDKFFCDVCGKQYGVRAVFMNHMALHSDARPFMCEECGKTLRSKDHLRRHKLSHKNWPCDECGKLFSGPFGKSNMYHHKKRSHGEKSFHCSFEACDKSFIYKSELTQHEIGHGNGSSKKLQASSSDDSSFPELSSELENVHDIDWTKAENNL